jgi:molybdopterin synthase catalytic subunit
MRRVVVQEHDFDASQDIALLGDSQAGGIANFIGIVRAGGPRPVVALTLEYYPGMTEKALDGIAADAARRWPLTGCTIIHRAGRLLPGENIVFVGAASAHRDAALQAVAFLIDWLKTRAPFWKAEEYESGERAWVAARPEDDEAARAWNVEEP